MCDSVSINKVIEKPSDIIAVGLLSGGLDSVLAIKIIQSMGIQVYGLYIQIPFCSEKNKLSHDEVLETAKNYGIPLKVFKTGLDFIDIIRNPDHEYGSGINPCVDCKIYMLRRAKEYLEELHGDFVITGEVVGQRPMSQTIKAMNIIEKESGLVNKIVRPLTSPRLIKLEENILSQIDFSKLPNISGRSRKIQMELAKQFDIHKYSSGGGGCIITEKEFGSKLLDYFIHNEEDNLEEIELLKLGRHFRLSKKVKLVVGRFEQENNDLLKFEHLGTLIQPEEKGPVGLLQGEELSLSDIETACKIIGRYCKADLIHCSTINKDPVEKMKVVPFKDEDLEPFWIKTEILKSKRFWHEMRSD